MSPEDREAQEDELLSLASIYSDSEFKRAESVQGGEISVCLELPQKFRIFMSGDSTQNLQKYNFQDAVCFLPPIFLNFEFPPDYPSSSAPEFTLFCKWLSPVQLTALCKQLDTLWGENRGSVILFTWVQFLKEETLTYLHIVTPYELRVYDQGKQNCKSLIPRKENSDSCGESDSADGEALDERAIQDVNSLSSLIRDILDFDQAQQKKCFNSKLYMCNICFSEKLGSECMDFKECQHVYCSACLKDYFEIQIKEGQVQFLNCPEPECTSVATPAQVKELVGEQLFSRYDRLLLQSSLDSMADVVYCPRLNCQMPVMQEPGCPMGICSSCRHPFCTLCKRTYHGISPCKTEEPMETNIKVPRIRTRKRRKQKIVEERQSATFLKEETQTCPACKVPIQKDGGCNFMVCSQCKHSFTWIPLKSLSSDNPA
ncbi:E3 ubiquitin-protein ligase RNF14 [Microcaecilia unicolor]|uniref:E3 ubiquitin-protein ligase RNF14 n=1 Tax=Microcaecilia unicolor TaxID=1415580 RepID=A0A6P7YUE9_9AMPH|nr:E3 ubiquitin-protein ligase RNF14-like [Microcaecilia unicolor]XP_030068272.1 E3 ubiquitin-protein ligase RNF14-like [Microcaecilia unicolor]